MRGMVVDYGVGGGRRVEYGNPVLPVGSMADYANVSIVEAYGIVDTDDNLHRHPDDSSFVLISHFMFTSAYKLL